MEVKDEGVASALEAGRGDADADGVEPTATGDSVAAPVDWDGELFAEQDTVPEHAIRIDPMSRGDL